MPYTAQRPKHGLPTDCGWRFHIAIHPDHTERAASILNGILADKTLGWHYYRSADKYDLKYSDIDEDLRGKKFCIFLPNADEPGEHSDRCQGIMLRCWKALQDAGVLLRYITPSGDKPILTDTGHPTPFSYAASKPNGERHGELHQTNYNPHGYEDPLDGLSFTERDLEEYGIRYNGINATKELVAALEAHIRESQARLNALIDKLVGDIAREKRSLIDILNEAKRIETCAEGVSLWRSENGSNRFPLQSDGCRPYYACHGRFERMLFKETLDGDEFSRGIDALRDVLIPELEAIMEDYNQLRGQGGIFGRSDIMQLVYADPNAMQEAYRKQVHMMHEKEQLVAAKQLQTKDELFAKIDREIKRLKGWSLFKASSESKIYLLECLRKKINDQKDGSVDGVIEGWKKSRLLKKNGTDTAVETGAIITRHRSLFFSEERLDSEKGHMKTSTELFIDELQRDFGDAPLGVAGDAEAATAAGEGKLEFGN